ncbi:MAG: S8 family serine peptidase [Planctomycetota bacterium]|jgi:subtilisin-like proprotein convertase family protein
MFPLSSLACGALVLTGTVPPPLVSDPPPGPHPGAIPEQGERPSFAFVTAGTALEAPWTARSNAPALTARNDVLVVEVHGSGLDWLAERAAGWRSVDPQGRVGATLSAGAQRHWLLWESAPRRADELEALALALSAQPDVQFVSTLAAGPGGEPVWGSPRLLLKGSADFDPQALADSNPGADSPLAWSSAAWADAWTWETGLRTSFAVGRLLTSSVPRVEWIEVDAWFGGRSSTAPVGASPDDPLYGSQWHHEASSLFAGSDIDVDSPGVWEQSLGSAAQGILVIDSGVEFIHPDLAVSAGTDLTGAATGGAPSNTFCEYHGTWVAGIACATQGNALGVSGVAPSARCLSARALVADPVACNGTWTTQVSWTVEALAWGAAQGATVTVNANEYGFEAQSIEDQYTALRAEGIAHVAAAGNTGFTGVAYPARLAAVTGVGACDDIGQRAWFSSSGPEVFVVAPGVEIWTTDPVGLGGFPFIDYVAVNGTSASAPIVAAGMALLQDLDPAADPDDLEVLLRTTAMDLDVPGYDAGTGWGLSKFANAGLAASGTKPRLQASSGELNLGVTVGAASGESVEFELVAGHAHAGDTYLIAANASGTSPGFALDGQLIPLNPDALFLYTAGQVNPAPWSGLLGSLDADGRAFAGVAAPTFDPTLAGVTANHVAVLLDLFGTPGLAAEPTAPEPVRLLSLTKLNVQAPGLPQPLLLAGQGTLVSSLTVPAPGLKVHALELDLQLQHPSLGDLAIDLEAPDGTKVRIHDQQGAGVSDLFASYPQDAAPDESLTTMTGLAADGVWSVRITNAGDGQGTLQGWGLRLVLE